MRQCWRQWHNIIVLSSIQTTSHSRFAFSHWLIQRWFQKTELQKHFALVFCSKKPRGPGGNKSLPAEAQLWLMRWLTANAEVQRWLTCFRRQRPSIPELSLTKVYQYTFIISIITNLSSLMGDHQMYWWMLKQFWDDTDDKTFSLSAQYIQ